VAERIIGVDGLSKRYRLYRRRHQTLKEIVAQRSRGEWEDLWALSDVTFDVPRGQFLGVIGHNGSGKSTLLKVLTGILRPNGGRVEIGGRVSSLLELGAGFHSEYSGRENVYLYGTLLGLRRREIDRHYESIVEFCELGDFMETPIKNYSSGMYVRLGFAVAVHLDPEILLIDEVLAVGDANFQRKCFQHLHRLRGSGCTIVLVSHDTNAVARFCERTLWLDHGRLMADGASDRVIQSYLDAVAVGPSLDRTTPTVVTPDSSPLLTITSVRLFDSEGRDVREAESGRPLRIEIGYRALEALDGLDLSVTVFRDDGVRCVDAPLHGITTREGRGTFVLDFPSFNLQGGSYDATVAVYDPARHRFHEFQDRLHSFTVRNDQSTGGLVWMDYSWNMHSEADLARKPA
jgi:ABC-type polysaccharide/polyol phosphate transport system ATPase subunit